MRKWELAVNLAIWVPVLVGLLTIPLMLVLMLAPYLALTATWTFYALGTLLLVRAKMPLFMRGIWTSFGMSEMDARHRKAYRQAYRCIGIGLVCNVACFVIVW